MTPDSAHDRAWMAQALALGSLGEGTASPNPRVGCVIVREGEAVGAGFHRRAGEPHAEAIAVAQAGTRARGATAYVGLEPCAHHGRTPPCADLLIECGIARVVAGTRDPDPRVDGKGFDRLRAAGIAVDVGVLADEARALNAAFVHWHRHGRPLVTIKAATSLDGGIAARDGESRWISGEPARRFAQRLRLRHDAVLVGGGTLRRDDPRLDVRLPETAVEPRMRVIVSASLDVPLTARVFDVPGPVLVYTGFASRGAARGEFASRAEIVEIPPAESGLDLGALLADLGRRGVQAVLVEGGGRTVASFLSAGLADEVALFGAPLLLGARGATPLVDGPTVSRPADGVRIDVRHRLRLGADVALLGRVVRD